MLRVALIAAIGLSMLAGCETAGPRPPATVPVPLAAATATSAAATEALLPKVVEGYCLAVAMDEAGEGEAAAKLGMKKAANPLHAVDDRFPARGWSTAETPRFVVWPSAAATGCTLAAFDGDLPKAFELVVKTAEAGRARRFGNAPAEIKLPAYEDLARGWRTLFLDKAGKGYTLYASHDNPDRALARGLVVTISQVN